MASSGETLLACGGWVQGTGVHALGGLGRPPLSSSLGAALGSSLTSSLGASLGSGLVGLGGWAGRAATAGAAERESRAGRGSDAKGGPAAAEMLRDLKEIPLRELSWRLLPTPTARSTLCVAGGADGAALAGLSDGTCMLWRGLDADGLLLAGGHLGPVSCVALQTPLALAVHIHTCIYIHTDALRTHMHIHTHR